MKTTTTKNTSLRSGLSIIELSAVVAVLMALTSILYVGAKAYKSGSDKAGCILSIQSVQSAVRSYSNLNGHAPGATVQNLKDKLVGSDKFVPTLPHCPAEGVYNNLGNKIPVHGELYMSCSLAEDEGHVPSQFDAW